MSRHAIKTPRPRGNRRRVFLPLLLLLSLAGCSSVPKATPGGIAALSDTRLPQRVAVLPFANRCSNPEAAVVLRRMFYNFFSSLNYADVELAQVDAVLQKNGLIDALAAGGAVSAEKLGRLLGVDAVVFGEAQELGKVYALVYANSRATLAIRLVSCIDGALLWEIKDTVTRHEGSLPLSLPGLAAGILKTAFSFQQADLTQVAAELCMRMVAALPNPQTQAALPPDIRVLVHNGASTLLQPGEELRVVMLAESGLSAGFSLPPLIDRLALEETEPGIYLASYTVRQHDRLADGRLVGYLHSAAGASRQWVDTLGPIQVGTPTELPAAIEKDTVLIAEQGPYLVKDALVVMPGATLTVEPGTDIWFHELGMVVRGRLRARGTAENPVRLSALGGAGWKGVFFDNAHRESTLTGCRIIGAEYGLRTHDSPLRVERCILQDNVWGAVAEGGRLEIRQSLVRSSRRAGVAARGADLRVEGSMITDNGAEGFLLEASRARIEGSNIVNNGGAAIRVRGDAAEVDAPHNWWGTENPGSAGVIQGAAAIEPVLTLPASLAY
jgi:hypothetical protein